MNLAFCFATTLSGVPEAERIPSLPAFNEGWFEALRLARKEWLLDRVRDIEAMQPSERQAALNELTDIDLAMIGMKRVKLEMKT